MPQAVRPAVGDGDPVLEARGRELLAPFQRGDGLFEPVRGQLPRASNELRELHHGPPLLRGSKPDLDELLARQRREPQGVAFVVHQGSSLRPRGGAVKANALVSPRSSRPEGYMAGSFHLAGAAAPAFA